jgi:hypothetical protein
MAIWVRREVFVVVVGVEKSKRLKFRNVVVGFRRLSEKPFHSDA